MFPFSREPKDPQPEQSAPAPKPAQVHPLDAMTGGVFSAATSGERAQRVRDWLASQPTAEQMQEVYKELSAKDKGAAKALRERLDELRRAKTQESVMAEWQVKAQSLLESARMNIADAIAWQRNAAKAGAPLSREPLASLRAQLAERIKKVEELQQRVMIQREAAMLLAQRIELLSTKAIADAEVQKPGLDTDVSHWREQSTALMAEDQWSSVDVRYPPQIEAAQGQLTAVWNAFTDVLTQALAARDDANAPLPPVPVWADELRVLRGQKPDAEAELSSAENKSARSKVDSEQRAAAEKAVEAGAMLLEQAVSSGHTKNMHSAAQALRQSLKKHGRLIDDALANRVHAALISAGELEGWQRWSADKVREQLVARAEALLVKRKTKGSSVANTDAVATVAVAAAVKGSADSTPESAPHSALEAADAVASPERTAAPVADSAAAAATSKSETAATALAVTEDGAESATECGSSDAAQTTDTADTTPKHGTAAASEKVTETEANSPTLELGCELVPTMNGRKLQETIRKLREEWKTVDYGGAPNHALWKRFDRALNAAHKFVDEWIASVRTENAKHRAQREALIAEVNAWAQQHANAGESGDWKAIGRQIHQFSERWRSAGHLSSKQFAELQPRWKEAIHHAALPLEAAQKRSVARRQALIAEAETLGAAPQLRIDAVKSLQQRWQAEAQTVPLDRKHEQRLWDAFRKPIDEAFNRKSQERERFQAAMSAHDQAVMQAAKALEAATASGDARRIRAAIADLQSVSGGQVASTKQSAGAAVSSDQASVSSSVEQASAPNDTVATKPTGQPDSEQAVASATESSTEPSADIAETNEAAASAAQEVAELAPATPSKPTKPLIAMRGDDRPGAKKVEPLPLRGARAGDRHDGARERRGAPEARRPRLGDAAFRAQREALEHAQAQLRKLTAQAHGAALIQLLEAWRQRQPQQVPSTLELGRSVSMGMRTLWVQALGGDTKGQAGQALLRLEIASEVPTPAEHLEERRALQLKLLTCRGAPTPSQTWGQDTAAVLASAHEESSARRLQNALKVLLK